MTWILKALMWPSPKLPTSRSPLNCPKLLGARAMPQGELSWVRPPATGREPPEQVAARIEDVDEAVPRTRDVIVHGGILLGVGHEEEPIADVRDPEGGETGREVRVGELAGEEGVSLMNILSKTSILPVRKFVA